MQTVLVTILNALAFSMILFLLSSGLSLVFGSMGILNLAHGSIYMVGGYIGLTVGLAAKSFWVGLAAGLGGAAVLGWIMDRGFLRQLYNKVNEQVLLTLGFVYLIQNLTEWIWGPLPRMGTPPEFLRTSLRLGSIAFPAYRLGIIVVGVLVAVGLWLLIERTRAGAVIRAGMENKEIVGGLGINYARTCGAVFMLGAALAGFAGFLGTPILGVNTTISMDILLYALIVVVTGGVGYVQGALLGSVIIGFIDTFGKVYFPELAMMFIYLTLIVILFVRPSGLLARFR